MENTQDTTTSNEHPQEPIIDGTPATAEMGAPMVADSAGTKARYAGLATTFPKGVLNYFKHLRSLGDDEGRKMRRPCPQRSGKGNGA
jgi:hypothetical protein